MSTDYAYVTNLTILINQYFFWLYLVSGAIVIAPLPQCQRKKLLKKRDCLYLLYMQRPTTKS